MKLKLLVALIWLSTNTFSQENSAIALIQKEMLENANSVIRNQTIEIDIPSKKVMKIKKHKVVTVLNEKGLKNIDAIEYYDKSRRIITIQAVVYNAFGKELKKIKRKDFRDQSVADGFSIFNDDRIIYLNYTPTEYPFTIIFDSEVETSNTAFIPSWMPIDDMYESVEKSSIQIKNNGSLGFKFKEMNLENRKIEKTETENTITYIASNLVAEKYEEYAPHYKKILPHVVFGLNSFSLEGVDGNANSWEEFSIWMYQNLLKDTETLPEETAKTIKTLVGNTIDPIEKAKIVYKYVQDKCRYVSIQLGIGGWKPMLVSDVDRLGYGDCKALSNYARILLKTVGVESYYTIIYAGNEKQSLDKDFVSMQGNHAILTLPVNNGYTFLECTSQLSPFGFNGDFTDDRFALIVKPNGGEIIKTNDYNNLKSSQHISGQYTIDNEGNLIGNVHVLSKGIQYDDRYLMERESKELIDKHYKDFFSWLNKLKINKLKFLNDKEKIEFSEDVEINVPEYTSIVNNMIMMPVNVFNRNAYIPQRYRNRINPFEISTGFYDQDDIEINLPTNFTVDSKPEDIVIYSKFGTYKMELTKINEGKFIYKRSLLFNKGMYDKSEYDEFRAFNEQIARADNAKIVLKSK
jgi:transglutaminase-like putative cysteine protease